MSRAQQRTVVVSDEYVECTPDDIVQTFQTYLAVAVSATVVAAMGTIAGGVFWAAQSFDALLGGGANITIRVA